jgi:hypothetical protein
MKSGWKRIQGRVHRLLQVLTKGRMGVKRDGDGDLESEGSWKTRGRGLGNRGKVRLERGYISALETGVAWSSRVGWGRECAPR